MNAYIFIGRSGCGKGTQAQLLQKEMKDRGLGDFFYVETGDVFRDFIKGDGLSNLKSRAIYESADRQPDFLACHMWTQYLISHFNKPTHVIFDGTPRSLTEAKVLETALDFYNFDKVFVVYIDVSREWSQEHLKARGRSDDQTSAKIDKRLNWFDTDVLPALDYFEQNSRYVFCKINGEQPIDAVHATIMNSLSV